ncbi:hypothetical protein DASC09_041790 [Saccharomycopsis crataegensis]|uniref:Uncharacterized protein n=1 Tax=Saccharomycopsis crataegensis TaxID=43959 RepID=A0AAV5QQZ8_9ASCO|nr:hypothetical protein DASC09_041790 [Saccharomycopsis crataegensis]
MMSLVKDSLEFFDKYFFIFNGQVCLNHGIVPKFLEIANDYFSETRTEVVQTIMENLNVTIGDKTYRTTATVNRNNRNFLEFELNNSENKLQYFVLITKQEEIFKEKDYRYSSLHGYLETKLGDKLPVIDVAEGCLIKNEDEKSNKDKAFRKEEQKSGIKPRVKRSIER